MAQSAARRSPPAEKPEAIRTRSLVVLAFWAAILFFGLPMWYKTTSVYRADLPFDEMDSWATGKVSWSASWRFDNSREELTRMEYTCRPADQPFHSIYVYTPHLYLPRKLRMLSMPHNMRLIAPTTFKPIIYGFDL